MRDQRYPKERQRETENMLLREYERREGLPQTSDGQVVLVRGIIGGY